MIQCTFKIFQIHICKISERSKIDPKQRKASLSKISDRTD